MRMKEQYSVKKKTWPNTDAAAFFFLFSLSPSLPSFIQYLTVQVSDTNLPVPDVNEVNLEHDVPPREPEQPGAVTATQELDGQQPEVASPLQEPSGEQAEAAGAHGK